MVLGGRHLIGIFFLLVVILGVVFTLGYLLGRNQYDSQLRAAAGEAPAPLPAKAPAKSPAKSPTISNDATPAGIEYPQRAGDSASRKDTDASTPPAGADWDFYHSAEPAKPAATVKPAPKAAPKQPQVISAANRPAANNSAVPAVKSAAHPKPMPANGAPAKALDTPLIPHGATVLQVAALVREADALALAQALQQKKFPAFVLSPDTDNFYRVQVGPYNDAASANAARQRLETQGFKSIIKR